jgi:hypothetical protein
MWGLSHVVYQRQELTNTLLCCLSHPEWIATQHCTAFFVRFIGEEISQRLDTVYTEFL